MTYKERLLDKILKQNKITMHSNKGVSKLWIKDGVLNPQPEYLQMAVNFDWLMKNRSKTQHYRQIEKEQREMTLYALQFETM